jgi:hypothetical protein
MKEKKGTLRGLPPANSAATALGPWSPVPPPRKRKGPAPGTVDRYGTSDRALYPRLERLMRRQKMSVTAAARQLADDGKVAGVGTPESRARRLARSYIAHLSR